MRYTRTGGELLETNSVQVSRAFEELLRILLDVGRLEANGPVFQQSRQIVVHVGEYHKRLAELEIGMIGCPRSSPSATAAPFASVLERNSPGS